MKHVPNTLTIARIILTPVFLVLILLNTFTSQLAALVVFIVAAVSDWLDGHVARRYAAGSELGRFLDPFADKILVLSAFVVLPVLLPGVVPWWAVIVIAVRDAVITVLRTFRLSRGRVLRTIPLAKLKTASQLTFLIAVMVLLVATKLPSPEALVTFAGNLLRGPVAQVFLYLVVALTAFTGIVYFVSRPTIKPEEPV